MTPPDWLDPSEIMLVTPETPEQMDALEDDIEEIASLLPGYVPGFISMGMRDYPDNFTVAYHNDRPIGYIEINDRRAFPHLSKDSLEFGGAVLPEYRDKGLTQQVAPAVIRQAFLRTGKKKMLAVIPDGSEEARTAIVSLGFRYIGKTQDRKLLYKLEPKDVGISKQEHDAGPVCVQGEASEGESREG